MKSDLTLALGNDAVGRDMLRSTLDRAANGDKDKLIFLRADKTVPYGELMEVMNYPAGGRLPQGLAGRVGEVVRTMMALEDIANLRRWVISGTIVVLAHGAFAAAMVTWRDTDEAAEPAAAIVSSLRRCRWARPSRRAISRPAPSR